MSDKVLQNFIDNDLRGGIIAQNPTEDGWSGGPVKRLCHSWRTPKTQDVVLEQFTTIVYSVTKS